MTLQFLRMRPLGNKTVPGNVKLYKKNNEEIYDATYLLLRNR